MVSVVKKTIASVARQPLVHFLVLGALFYALWTWFVAPRAAGDDNTIVVTAADVGRLEAAWRARWRRPPTPEEASGLVRGHVREIALYRHAVAMGLDQNDPVIRRVLGQKLQSIAQNLVELSLAPSDQELATFYEGNEDRYRPPELATFSQVFLNPDRRGEDTLKDAETLLAELRRLPEPKQAPRELGDSFMLQADYVRVTPRGVQRQFGEGFAQSVFELEPGEWHGPVLSGYGVHLVFVREIVRTALPELAQISEEVKQDWIDERRRELQEQFIDEVLARYEVKVEDSPAVAEPSRDRDPGAPAESLP